MFIASFFLPGMSDAQLLCPQYHFMIEQDPINCLSSDNQQVLSVKVDKQDAFPANIKGLNILLTLTNTALVDQVKTIASINQIFSASNWSFDLTIISQTTLHFFANANTLNGNCMPINLQLLEDEAIFKIFYNGNMTPPLNSHIYNFNFFPSGNFIVPTIGESCLEINECTGNGHVPYELKTPAFIIATATGFAKYKNDDNQQSCQVIHFAFPNLSIQLFGFDFMNQPSLLSTAITNSSGFYGFPNLKSICPYRLVPNKTNYPLCGVTIADKSAVSKHLLGIQPLIRAYQFIAADVNNDHFITASDLPMFNEILLGIISDFPKNWQFLDNELFEDWDINGTPAPMVFNDFIDLDLSTGSLTDINIAGVKVGDVNGTCNICDALFKDDEAVTRNSSNKSNNIQSLKEKVEMAVGKLYQMKINQDDRAELIVTAPAEAYVSLISMNLPNFSKYDVKIEAGKDVELESFMYHQIKSNNELRFLSTVPYNFEYKTKTIEIARIKFEKELTSEFISSIRLKQDPDYNYYSTKRGEMYNIHNFINEDSNVKNRLNIYPNPAGKTLYISLPIDKQSSSAEIKIKNIEGKQIFLQKLEGQIELNDHSIDISSLNSGQIYLIQLKSADKIYTSRFIKQ